MKSNSNSILSGSLFNPQKIPEDAKEILDNFDSLIQDNLPLNSRQILKLPEDIRRLSHLLTDERDMRRLSYMNDKTFLSAYARYFMWWNLTRLSRLFSNIDISKINLHDNDICLDIGSGPLTVVTALWLSRPELRKIKLVWYCLDLSQSSLSLGENLYLSVVAKTVNPELNEIENHWKIVRVKGSFGTAIRQKAKFISCANMFNEVFQSESRPLDFLAKKYCNDLEKYADKKTSFLIVEPGVPRSARFISLLRDCFIRKGFQIIAPCSHCDTCPMDGRLLKGQYAKKASDSNRTGKWCNFTFPAKSAPEKLQKLSAAAKLPKERAVLSFVFSTQEEAAKSFQDESHILLRIASEPIRLGKKTGFYACSKLGLVLYIPNKSQLIFSGDLISVEKPEGDFKRDFKTGAIIIE